LKFTNTASPPPSPKFHILEGRQKKIFVANAPTSSPPNLGPSLRQCCGPTAIAVVQRLQNQIDSSDGQDVAYM